MLKETIIALSQNKPLRNWSESSAAGKRVCRRFVAGTGPEDVLKVVRTLNAEGMAVTVDNLGESVTCEEDARHSSAVYHEMLEQIAQTKVAANISVKLTQMGMDVDEDLCLDLMNEIAAHAARNRNFVRVDMEGSVYTERTLDLICRLNMRPANGGAIGAVIQAYLYRSEHDVQRMVGQRIPIRLCKGAYSEPSDIAFRRKAEVDDNFVKLMKILLKSGIFHGIATHDEQMIDATIRFAETEGISPERFEFQMLYGIRRDLQRALVARGYGMRVYTPFGTEWYPYFMRRIAERPANAFFVAKSFFRG